MEVIAKPLARLAGVVIYGQSSLVALPSPGHIVSNLGRRAEQPEEYGRSIVSCRSRNHRPDSNSTSRKSGGAWQGYPPLPRHPWRKSGLLSAELLGGTLRCLSGLRRVLPGCPPAIEDDDDDDDLVKARARAWWALVPAPSTATLALARHGAESRARPRASTAASTDLSAPPRARPPLAEPRWPEVCARPGPSALRRRAASPMLVRDGDDDDDGDDAGVVPPTPYPGRGARVRGYGPVGLDTFLSSTVRFFWAVLAASASRSPRGSRRSPATWEGVGVGSSVI
eukprot:scaffold115_cov304-Prasinococcus_capsulatus_cf.AAC.33